MVRIPHLLIHRFQRPRYREIILQLDSDDLVREGLEESVSQSGSCPHAFAPSPEYRGVRDVRHAISREPNGA